MLGGAALDHALVKGVITRPSAVQYFRAIAGPWAFDPLGRGRPIADMRFNVAHGARILYVGENPVVCMQEAQASGFPATSMVCVPVEVRLDAILDLRHAATRTALDLKMTDIQLNFRGLNKAGMIADTQTLGERCAALKVIDGIYYPSVPQKGGSCIAVLESNLTSGKTHVIVKEQLDPNGDRMYPVPAGRTGPPSGLPLGIWDRLP